MGYSYERTAGIVSFDKLSKAMKEGVEALYESRAKFRKVHEMLSEVANDASGVAFTDNYNDPEIRRVAKMLYDMDHEVGMAASSVESLEKKLRKKAKTASSDALAVGAVLEIVARKGPWPPDMFTKGSTVVVVDGGSVGGTIKVKIRGSTMGGPYEFKVLSEKDSTYTLLSHNDKFSARGLKVKIKP